MLALVKFVFVGLVIAAFLIVGASSLPYPVRSELGLQEASSQADNMVRQVAAQFPSSLHSFSESTGDFVRSNTSSARLQIENLKDRLPASFAMSNFIPSRTSTWIQTGAETASGLAGHKPQIMANGVPLVNRVVTSTVEHMASLKHTLGGAGDRF